MADAQRSFPHPDEVAEDSLHANEYMVSELPTVKLVHPLAIGADELIMCVHLENDTERVLTFPRAFLPAYEGDQDSDEDKAAYAERCDGLMKGHAERILRAVWN